MRDLLSMPCVCTYSSTPFLRWFLHQERLSWDFPGGPAVRTSPSSAGGVGSIPGGRAKVPHASWLKNQNRSNIVTNSMKTFKMAHIKNILKKQKQKRMPVPSSLQLLLLPPRTKIRNACPLSSCIRTHQRKLPGSRKAIVKVAFKAYIDDFRKWAHQRHWGLWDIGVSSEIA